MLEITGDDIAELNDGDLRTLVARLCEASLRARGLPTSAVTWGGDQRAKDAGIDVRVALTAGTEIDGFVPCPATGFQVKASDMPRSDIIDEMCPIGTVRPAIAELAKETGAYVIVSSKGSVSDLALKNRRNAMTEAVDGLDSAQSLNLEFYDRTRISTWLRDHPGLIPWVRKQIGKEVPGWQSYGVWAFSPDGVEDEFLLDDRVRIRTPKIQDENGLSAAEGVARIRDVLREPGKVVRIVGLPGVGKTRLVQALFDERVGEKSLDPTLAIYTDMADDPSPQPMGMATDLIASRYRAILVVDNCGPDLHRRVSDVARSQGSLLSVITVEYDIREDQPEETEVFEVEPSSIDLIEQLVMRRKPDLSQVDARSIADFSGGNALIALALAATIDSNESIAGLKDAELFRRLFQQKHEHDQSLMRAAQACALVYSFEGEQLEGNQAELPRLGALVGQSATDIFDYVAELKRRDMVQQRSVWRAVLPHAIANRLAQTALENIAPDTIQAQLVDGVPRRLFRSFTRRLGYLHESKEALAIVNDWLAEGGLLGDVADLNDLESSAFENVAPVAPEAALAALERALDGENGEQSLSRCTQFVRLLRSLAYDAPLFDRAVDLISRFAEAEDDKGRQGDTKNIFASLFHLYLSGTHATIDQRLRVIEDLLRSESSTKQRLGLDALRAVLEAWHFSSVCAFEFGARSRDFGYRPRDGAEVQHWFGSASQLAEAWGCSDEPVAPEIRGIVASKFRGLWCKARAFDDLERLCRAYAAKGFWSEGWIGVQETRRFDAKKMLPEDASRLTALEELLRPRTIVDRVRAIALSTRLRLIDLGDFEFDEADDAEDGYQRTETLALKLGEELIGDEESFQVLLPEIVSGNGRLFPLGRGLGRCTDDPGATWERLIAELEKTDVSNRNIQFLRGFLAGVNDRDPEKAGEFLEKAVDDETLAQFFPSIQTAVPIDARGSSRLQRALALGKASIKAFHVLALGRATDPIAPEDLSALLREILDRDGGFDVAVDILSMRFQSDRDGNESHAPELIETGRELLRQIQFGETEGREDYSLGIIVRASLREKSGEEIGREIYRKLKEAVSTRETQAHHHDDLMKGLLQMQPTATLDDLFAGDEKERKKGEEIIDDMTNYRSNPLEVLPEAVLLAWCDQEPETRYTIAAANVTVVSPAEQEGSTQWSPLALQLFKRTPNKISVLGEFTKRLRPRSWSGSLAAIMESNMKLLDEFKSCRDSDVVEFLAAEKRRLLEEVRTERRWETERDKDRDERFE